MPGVLRNNKLIGGIMIPAGTRVGFPTQKEFLAFGKEHPEELHKIKDGLVMLLVKGIPCMLNPNEVDGFPDLNDHLRLLDPQEGEA